jgi:hypothetical protein
VVEGHARDARVAAHGRIPTFEARTAVVVSVRVLPVQHQVTRDVDLVGRVVVEKPLLRPVAQADLEHRRRNREQGDDGDAEPTDEEWLYRSNAENDHRGEGDEETGNHPGRLQDSLISVPVPVGSPDERSEDSVCLDRGRRKERPAVRAEFRQDDRHEQAEDAEHGRRLAPCHRTLGTGWPEGEGSAAVVSGAGSRASAGTPR